MRLSLAEQNGETELPCLFVDLSEDEERLILASLDPIAAMAAPTATSSRSCWPRSRARTRRCAPCSSASPARNTSSCRPWAVSVDPDVLPALPEKPVTKPGDLWLLGPHKLLCGNSTKTEEVQGVMAGERAALMAFDGPYGVSYDGGNHPQTWGKDGQEISPEDKTRHWDDYEEAGALRAFYGELLAVALQYALSEAPIFYQWFAMTKVEDILAAWKANGLLPHQVVIWHKSRAVLGAFRLHVRLRALPLRLAPGPAPRARPATTGQRHGGLGGRAVRSRTALLGIHPTQKAVELIRRPILWHTKPDDVLYEPCAGSGTAIIAAEMTGRSCYAIELAPQFVDVTVLRWQRFGPGGHPRGRRPCFDRARRRASQRPPTHRLTTARAWPRIPRVHGNRERRVAAPRGRQRRALEACASRGAT